jgi:hypothetical protein
MDPSPDLVVSIRRDGQTVANCRGPGKRGQCTVDADRGVVPCAGADLHVSTAPDDLWVFTAPTRAHSCPLAWLVTATERSPTQRTGHGIMKA